MVSIETKKKIKKYLKKVGGSNLTEIFLATKVCRSMETMRKWIRKLEEEGMLDVKKEFDEKEYWITLKKK